MLLRAYYISKHTLNKGDFCSMKKIFTYGIAALAVISIVGVNNINASAISGHDNWASAGEHIGDNQHHGRQGSLDSRAKILGVSTTDLEAALETKTMSQIALEHGLNDADFQAKMQAASLARWESRGLSTSEIATHITEQQERHNTNSSVDHKFSSGDNKRQGGYSHNHRSSY